MYTLPKEHPGWKSLNSLKPKGMGVENTRITPARNSASPIKQPLLTVSFLACRKSHANNAKFRYSGSSIKVSVQKFKSPKLNSPFARSRFSHSISFSLKKVTSQKVISPQADKLGGFKNNYPPCHRSDQDDPSWRSGSFRKWCQTHNFWMAIWWNQPLWDSKK